MRGTQGGPAKVRPTYIFAGNVILVTFEWIGKIQCFFGKCDNSLAAHTLGSVKIKYLILFVRWPKIIRFYLRIQMLPAKLASL